MKSKIPILMAKLKSNTAEPAVSFRSPNEKDFQKVEKILNRALSKEGREFFQASGAILVPPYELAVAVEEAGYQFVCNIALSAWEEGAPKDSLPICLDNGNYFFLRDDGVVAYWDHNGFTQEFWASLEIWIEKVLLAGS